MNDIPLFNYYKQPTIYDDILYIIYVYIYLLYNIFKHLTNKTGFLITLGINYSYTIILNINKFSKIIHLYLLY